MAFSREIEGFIRTFVTDLQESNVAIFAGAGLSVPQGFVNWSELLREIADELNLSVDKERDLISLAQFHVNENSNRAGINRKILEEFTEEAVEGTNHQILARLPITTYWTTNYDQLLEKAIEKANKRVDVKHSDEQLAITRPRRDAVVYKMHGDATLPARAVITKQDYQTYHIEHAGFVTALSGDLVSKTFLFIGFSFTDPNLDYVLGRLSIQFGKDGRQHYAFFKRLNPADYDDEDAFRYDERRHQLMINDLKNYNIKALLVDKYDEITEILLEIESRYRKRTVFISGSAEEYGKWSRSESQSFIHNLSKRIIESGCTIVNGFGWGVGSAVINGALEAIRGNPKRHSNEQLILFPFPQFATGEKSLTDLWEEYRKEIIPLAGIAIFIFGNKLNEEREVVNATGVRREFEIALESGLVPIPIGATGYESQELYNVIKESPQYLGNNTDAIMELLDNIANPEADPDQITDSVLQIIKKIQE